MIWGFWGLNSIYAYPAHWTCSKYGYEVSNLLQLNIAIEAMPHVVPAAIFLDTTNIRMPICKNMVPTELVEGENYRQAPVFWIASKTIVSDKKDSPNKTYWDPLFLWFTDSLYEQKGER